MRAEARGGPMFVAGPDRSGTTLMFSLLASHPDISMVRRTNMWRYFHGRYGDLADRANLERCLAAMLAYRRLRHLQPDAERIRREFLAAEPSYGRLFALFHEHNAERAGKPRWGDKSLHTEHYAERLFAEFPDAYVVHMVRDPRDRYASVRRRYGQDLCRVGAATGRWLASARAGRRNRRRHPERYLLVRYEDLALRPHATMGRVCAFVGASCPAEMFALGGVAERAGANSSFGDLEPRTISTRAVGRFRTVLSDADVAFVQLLAGRELVALGYERVEVCWSRRAALAFAVTDLPAQLARMAGSSALAAIERRAGERVPAARARTG